MSNKLQISPRLREIVDRELKPHEVIQWIGQPIPRFFTFQSTMYFLIGIPLTAHLLFLFWSATGFGNLLKQGLTPDVLSILFYVPVILMSICMLLSPIWTRLMALQTVYLITDQRAISIEGYTLSIIEGYTLSTITSYKSSTIGGWAISTSINVHKSSRILSYSPQQLQTVYRQESKDGTGNVIITIQRWKDSDGDEWETPIGFMQIRDPRQVETLLKTLADIEI